MQSTASAPGKAILFGEHAVVFRKPAIAVAVDKRATITIKEGTGKYTSIKSKDLGFNAELDLNQGLINLKTGKSGIIKYILEVLLNYHDKSPLDIELRMDMPIGAGLGSSAAVTVATIAALKNYNQEYINQDYHNLEYNEEYALSNKESPLQNQKSQIKIPSISNIAKQAHQVEIKVQGAASPLDTAVSAYGGLIYLSENSEVIPLDSDLDDSLVIGYTSFRGNTGKMVAGVKRRRDAYPDIMDPLIESVGKITKKAYKSLITGQTDQLGELMNINHGLLDSMGVSTLELSKMVYLARKAGASGSKITGAGGGGSIIAYCPGKIDEVLNTLQGAENAIKADFSKKGVLIHE